MPWRRRKAGRKRKTDAKRKPSGQIRYEPTTPPDEVIEKRRALFGSEKAQAETDWLIDRLWGAGELTNEDREAAQRLRSMVLGRLSRIGAPRVAMTSGAAVSGSSSPDQSGCSEELLDLEHRAALEELTYLDRQKPGVRQLTIGAVMFETLDRSKLNELRWALGALASHFKEPRSHRLSRVERPTPTP